MLSVRSLCGSGYMVLSLLLSDPMETQSANWTLSN